MACNVGRSPYCIDGRSDVAQVELSWEIQMSDHQDLTSGKLEAPLAALRSMAEEYMLSINPTLACVS
jgi:hypothetical protein